MLTNLDAQTPELERTPTYYKKKGSPIRSFPLFFQLPCNYQITTRLEGARYIPSDFFTLKVSYHSGKFLGGMLARR